MQNNQIQVQKNQQVVATQLSEPQQLMVSIAQSYCEIFPTYDVNNSKRLALQFANKLVNTYSKTKQPALQVCTKESIQQAFFEVLDKNIDLSKSQGALIVRGNQLCLNMEYFGNVKNAKESIPNLVDIRGTIIYKGDEIQVSVNNGLYKIEGHKTNFSNMKDENIIGAYSIAIYRDENGKEYQGEVEIMNAQELKNSWLQSSQGTAVHSKFGHEMARKTVESRNAKHLLNKLSSSKFSFNTDDVEETEQINNENVIDVASVIETQEEKIVEKPVVVEQKEEVVVEVIEPQQHNPFEGFNTFGQVVEEPKPQQAQPNIQDLNSLGDIFNNNSMNLPNDNFHQKPSYSEPIYENTDDKLNVSYKDWIKIYQPTGQWKQGKYDSTTKMITITRIS